MAKENKRQMLVDACNEKIDELTGEKNDRGAIIDGLRRVSGSAFAHKDTSREFVDLEKRFDDLLEKAKALGKKEPKNKEPKNREPKNKEPKKTS